eukprot:COSAG02_NODE_623_length_19389_cov_30.043753_1_plen_58_part_10
MNSCTPRRSEKERASERERERERESERERGSEGRMERQRERGWGVRQKPHTREHKRAQ